MDTMSKNSFRALLKKIFELPIWIKQSIYLEIKHELEQTIKDNIKLIKKDNSLQLYIPKATFLGKTELESRAKNLDENIYKFLSGCMHNLSIIEIAINYNWSLAECSTYFINAINSELIIPPESTSIKGTALYMGGFIRLGEYFVKLGKITLEQLDEALRTQKYIENTVKDKIGIAQILINLGYLTKADVEGILLLKEECKKRYIPDDDLDSSDDFTDNSEAAELKRQISQLTKENNQLKDQMRKMFKI